MTDPNYIETPVADPVPGQPGHFDHHVWLKESVVTLDTTVKDNNDARIAAHNALADLVDGFVGDAGLEDGSAIVGTNDTQELKNKTIDGDDNSISNIPASAVKQEAWTSWSPAFPFSGGAIGNGVVSAHYQRVGNTVHFRYVLNTGSTTSYGSGNFTLDLPVTAHADYASNGSGVVCTLFHNSVNYVSFGFFSADCTEMTFMYGANATTGALSSPLSTTGPVTVDATDSFRISGTYECA